MDGMNEDDDVGMEVDEQASSSAASSSAASSSSSSPSPPPQRSSQSRARIQDDDDDDDDDGDDDDEDNIVNKNRGQSSPEVQHEPVGDNSAPASPASSTTSSTRAAQPPPPVDIRTEIDMPCANPDVGTRRHYVKLPNFLSIGTHEYDPLYYEDEIDDDEERDYEGRAKLKLRVENTIRWRKTKDEDDNDQVESNARVVEWSDGTMSLYLGSEIFDINEKPIGENSHLYVRMGLRQGLQCQAIFDSKLSIRPNSTESFTHRKLTLSLADRSQKTQKIRMLNNPGQDPEARLNDLSKKEDDKMKATMRRETKQRKIQERSQSGGPSASYLEDYEEEDDDGSISLAAIKRNSLARRDEYSEDSEEEYSDDSDPEFGKVQRKSDRTKKKPVVEESDDE